MGYATRLGRARISAVAPQAAGQCDRCGFMFTLSKLQFQMDYAGAGLVNKRLLVCHGCMDRPQDQFRAIVIPADPIPVQNPRPPDWLNISPAPSADRLRVTQNGAVRTTQDGRIRDLTKVSVDRLRATQSGDTRIVQDGRIRDLTQSAVAKIQRGKL